jgi:hypothetical protein
MPPTWPKSESRPSLHSFRRAPATAGLGVLCRSQGSCPPNESVRLKPHTLVAGCDAIVTHNVRDFWGASRFVPRVVSPAEFLSMVQEQS